MKKILGSAVIFLLSLAAVPVFAGGSVQMKMQLVSDCGPGCQTDIGGWSLINQTWMPTPGTGTFSMLPGKPQGFLGNDGLYFPSVTPPVQSEILTHNTVYTLDTAGTLVGGLVADTTYTVRMHFFTTAGNLTPSCWTSALVPNSGTDQTQAVLWSILSNNATAFTELQVNQSTVASARADFNVRNGSCDQQVFRFYLKWPSTVTIKRVDNVAGKRVWQVTTDQYGTASLFGQGGRSKSTVTYGDYRMPFKMILTEQ